MVRFEELEVWKKSAAHKFLLGVMDGHRITSYIFGGIMSTDTMERLRSEALALTETERAELAYDLIESLDAPADVGVENAWDIEITRRITQIDAGQAKFLNRDEFRKKLQDKIGNR